MPSDNVSGRLLDIVENIDRIFQYTASMTSAEYAGNQLVVDAVERCLQRVTEASIRLQPHAADILPMHDWRAMRDFGNVLRHDYHRIATEIVWQIIETDLPALRHDCLAAIDTLENG